MKKKILIFNRNFYPSYRSGGPVRSLVNLTAVLKDKFLVDVVTSNNDLSSSDKLDVEGDRWLNSINKSKVIYTTTPLNTFKSIKQLNLDNYSYVYLNSFFDFRFSIAVIFYLLLASNYKGLVYLAPRGELTHGAFKFKKIKKKFYLSIFNLLKFNEKVVFHFTSLEEKLEAEHYLGHNIRSILIPNMHEKIKDINTLPKKEGGVSLLFLSRISEKKNLITALRALKAVSSKVEVNFTIAGPIDSEKYWVKCKEVIKSLPNNINIIISGPLDRGQVKEAFKASHAFILPTYNENYGHAIVEAMIYGCIPIISTETPWSEVSERGGLVNLPDDISAFTKAIEAVAHLSQESFEISRLSINSYVSAELKKNEKLIIGMFDNV